MSVIETRMIAARGLQFTASVAGPGDGPLVLLLHGFPQTRHTWRAELDALADAGFRACAPDQRGVSPGARPEGIESYAAVELVADALAIADALGAERFDLVGHDWGGQLAWMLTGFHPERVNTLAVLSRPHPQAFVRAMQSDERQSKRSGHHRSFLRAEATDELLADDAARLRAVYASSQVPAEDAAVYLETLRDRDALDAAIHWYRAAGTGPRPAPVPAIVRPTLYVWGSEDATVGRAAAEGTRAFVDAPYRFEEVPGAGHFLTDERPELFPPLLRAHLREHDRAQPS